MDDKKMGSLSITRNLGESFKIITGSGDIINIKYNARSRDSRISQVKLLVTAPKEYLIYRDEVFMKILYENKGKIPGTTYQMDLDDLGNR